MFEIIINGRRVNVLQPIDTVHSIVINHMQGVQIPIAAGHIKAVAEWLYNLTQQVDYTTYNNVLLDKESINKPAHM